MGNIISTEQGNPGEKVKLTVDGLKPFSNYTAELIVRNQDYATTTGQMLKQTVATSEYEGHVSIWPVQLSRKNAQLHF